MLWFASFCRVYDTIELRAPVAYVANYPLPYHQIVCCVVRIS